jgi:hypothetical protein
MEEKDVGHAEAVRFDQRATVGDQPVKATV